MTLLRTPSQLPLVKPSFFKAPPFLPLSLWGPSERVFSAKAKYASFKARQKAEASAREKEREEKKEKKEQKILDAFMEATEYRQS